MCENAVLGQAQRTHGGRRVAAADHAEAVRRRRSPGPPRGCPPRTAPSRTRPWAVPEHRLRPGEHLGEGRHRSGPMSRPIQPSGIASTGTVRVAASAANASATTTSEGSRIFPDSSRPRQVAIRSASSSEPPTGWPWAARNVKHIPPPTSRASTFGSRASMTASLSETFEPPRTTTYGRSGSVGELAQHLHLGQDQTARVGGELLGHVVDRGLLAVHHPEPVGDERAVVPGERDELRGQRGAVVVVLAGLAGVEPDVLQHDDVAGRHAQVTAPRVPVGGLDQPHRGAEQLPEPRGHRRQRAAPGPGRPSDGPGAR